ncbi:MAG: hypothetical protein LCH86_09730 [Proteobacteria bacterium]|nr:hypothetical protein [Pseudomonadota bacterium]
MTDMVEKRRPRRRWSDNDRHFGPLTYSRDSKYRPIAVILSSGDDDDSIGCNLRMSAIGRTFIVELPAIIKPWRTWVDTSKYDWACGKGYWDIHERQYGFSVNDGYLDVSLGRQTNDSSTEQRKGYFLPWTQWRFVRKSFYDDAGAHFWTAHESTGDGFERYQTEREAQDRCPSFTFVFTDFDGERLTAKIIIQEYEWKFGTGYFKWLSLFRRAKVRRSLDIQFSGETGRRKGSWKGGTIGHSIDTLPGELHESAFRRYCAQHEMTFIGLDAAVSNTRESGE